MNYYSYAVSRLSVIVSFNTKIFNYNLRVNNDGYVQKYITCNKNYWEIPKKKQEEAIEQSEEIYSLLEEYYDAKLFDIFYTRLSSYILNQN